MLLATTNDIRNFHIIPVPLSQKFRDFYGFVPSNEQFNVHATGAPSSGKSTFYFMSAKEFAKSGEVLYCTFEERLNAGAIKKRINELKIPEKNLTFLQPDCFNDIVEELKRKKYAFCFIDSVNECYDEEDRPIAAKDVIRIAKQFVTTSFFFVSQINSQLNKAAGGQKATHKADVKIFCKQDKKTGERIAYLDGNRFYPKVTEFQIVPPQKPNHYKVEPKVTKIYSKAKRTQGRVR